jgi:hypothetical protein
MSDDPDFAAISEKVERAVNLAAEHESLLVVFDADDARSIAAALRCAAEEIIKLEERCAAYKGQVEAGALRIAELERERGLVCPRDIAELEK